MMSLYISHIRPLLEFSSSVWNLGYISDLKLLEGVQRRWTKKITGFEDLTYSQRLANLNLYSVKGRLLRSDLIKCWKIFQGKSCINPESLFIIVQGSSTRGHRFKVAHRHCNLEVRRRVFAMRVVQPWNSLTV